jgi:hypothetical protein
MQATTFMSRRPPPRAYDRSPHAAARFVKPADPPHNDLPFSFRALMLILQRSLPPDSALFLSSWSCERIVAAPSGGVFLGCA